MQRPRGAADCGLPIEFIELEASTTVPNGIYAAATGMAAQQLRIDALASDLANVNTTGYKKTRIGFRDLEYADVGDVKVGSGAAAVDGGRSLVQGALQESGDPLSVALEGPGFFQVKLADGRMALTRSGDFRLDAQGALVLAGGERVQPPVVAPKGVTPDGITIGRDGAVTAGGKKIGQLTVVDVPAPSRLTEIGGGFFVPTEASGAAKTLAGVSVRQGFLEGSNVDVAETMVAMIESQRAFELASRAVKLQDQLLEIANGIRR